SVVDGAGSIAVNEAGAQTRLERKAPAEARIKRVAPRRHDPTERIDRRDAGAAVERRVVDVVRLIRDVDGEAVIVDLPAEIDAAAKLDAVRQPAVGGERQSVPVPLFLSELVGIRHAQRALTEELRLDVVVAALFLAAVRYPRIVRHRDAELVVGVGT